MASLTRQLHRTYPLINLTSRSRIFPGARRYATTCDSERDLLRSQLDGVCDYAVPNTVALLSYFAGPESREIPHTVRRATGVFVDPTLVVTSARAVGLLSTVYDSDRSAVLHNCFLARTITYTVAEEVLRTCPVAVNFEADVAVLKILSPRKEAEAADVILADAIAGAGDAVVGLVRHGNCSVVAGSLPLKQSSRRKNSGRPRAPWPLDDELEWVDYGIVESRDSVLISLPDAIGSPWFNFRNELVGIASWAAEAEAEGGLRTSYAVPPARINSVLHYAKTKGLKDPIVMDSWINKLTIADHNLDINQECVPPWPRNLVFAIMTY